MLRDRYIYYYYEALLDMAEMLGRRVIGLWSIVVDVYILYLLIYACRECICVERPLLSHYSVQLCVCVCLFVCILHYVPSVGQGDQHCVSSCDSSFHSGKTTSRVTHCLHWWWRHTESD